MGFFKKDKKLKTKENSKKLAEAPLGYWEEKSYMMAIPEKEEDILMPNEIVDKISSIENVTVKEYKLDEKNILNIKLNYDNEEYEVGVYPSGFTLPDVYIYNYFHFNDEEIEKLKQAKSSLTIFMKFNKDIKKSFHLQLKLTIAIMPNLIGLVDESAERLIPAKWAKLAANSKVTPAPSDMYNIQVVYNENGEVWLHTHGLCRCGLTELEILKSNKENYKNHYNVINTFASYIIDKNGEFDPRKDYAFLGVLSNRQPIVAICKSWTEAIAEYDHLELGSADTRKDAHNTKTSPIFIYKTEEDQKNNKISKITDYDNLWDENPIFFFSDEETLRMKTLAMERFDYAKKAFQDKENKILVKIGLKVDSGKDFEHIWFELLEFDDNKFKARLTQEPYNVSNIHTGDEKWFTIDDITDWIIYTPKFDITPSNIYLL